MRTIANRANGTFDSGILRHGARGEAWRAWEGVLRVKNSEAGSCTVSVTSAITGEDVVAPLAVGANAGVSTIPFEIPDAYRVTVTGVTGATACRIVLDGDTGNAGQTDLLALYDFTDGDVGNLNFGSNVRGAVSRDSLVYVDAGTQRRTNEFGLLVEVQRSNKCTNTNLKPTDTSGTTSSGAVATYEAVPVSQAPSGIDDPQGNVTGVYRLVASGSGATVTFGGVTGNTNPHTGSIWAYVVSGTWTLEITGETAALTGGWQRLEVNKTLCVATDQLSVVSTSAGEIYFFGNQLEEGDSQSNTRSSLIEITGAAATRLGDNVFTNTPASLDTSSFAVGVEFQTYAPIPVNDIARSVQLDSGTDTAGTILFGAVRHTTLTNLFRDESTFNIDTGVVNVVGVPQIHAFGFDGQGNAAMAVDWGNYSSAAGSVQPAYSFIRFSSRAASDFQMFGYIRQVAVFNRAGTNDYLSRVSSVGGRGFDSGFDGGFG